MSLYKTFKTDPKLESDAGVTLDMGSAKFTVHRAGGANKAFAELLTKRRKPLQRQIDAGTLDNDVAARLLAEVYAETVVKGWEGVTDEAGKPLEFNRANCIKLFLDLPDLFSTIQEEATRAANFRQAQIEADTAALKND